MFRKIIDTSIDNYYTDVHKYYDTMMYEHKYTEPTFKNLQQNYNTAKSISLTNNLEDNKKRKRNKRQKKRRNERKKMEIKKDKYIMETMNSFEFVNVMINDDLLRRFLEFCISKGMYVKNDFDPKNPYTIYATHLPDTFFMLSQNEQIISKKNFIDAFIYKGFNDINKLVSELQMNNEITFNDFVCVFINNQSTTMKDLV